MKKKFTIEATEDTIRDFIDAQIDWIEEFEGEEFWYFICGEESMGIVNYDLRATFKESHTLEEQMQKLFDWRDRDCETASKSRP